jgi:hypothetical protein
MMNARLLSVVMTTLEGSENPVPVTEMLEMTLLLPVSIAETLPERLLTTSARVPSGVTAVSVAPLPTVSWVTMLSFAVSITVTVLVLKLGT